MKDILKDKPYIKYAKEVIDGTIVAGQNVIMMCQRFLEDLDNDKWDFRIDKVDRCLNFISMLKHFKGKSSGHPFILEPWQQTIVANIFGFYWKGTNDRRFISSYIEVSRKNGKSALAAALCMFALIADGEDGAEVDLAANSREQARIAFEFCYEFAKQLDPSGKYLTSHLKGIKFNVNASQLKVFAADASKLDGFNASFGLIDEYHAAKNSKVRDVIKSSMGMRQNPHLCTITTAGFDKTLPCYQLRSTAIEILHKLKEDDSMFIAIYSLDDNDDWTDEDNWVKCTPNMDITVTKKYIKEQVKSALNNPSEEVGVKTKTLNLWCDSSEVWLSDSYIVNSTKQIDLAKYQDELCYIGVDLSATSDLTAVSYLVVKDGIYYFKNYYYLPESCLVNNSNREKYRLWRNQHQLNITSGNVTDYDYITKDMLKWIDTVSIQKVGYDKWNATQWAIQATEEGLPLEEYSQSIGNFNQPTKELERLILSGKVVIDNNEITRWCFSNVHIKEDHNENVKPIKTQKQMKIDGVIAMITALGCYLQNPNNGKEIFII